MHRFGEDLRLLVATDLSARSDRAVERAVELARAWKAPLTLLHVVSDELPRSVMRAGVVEAERALKSEVAPWREEGLKVECIVATGHDYEAIIAEAERGDAKLVVMGTHRKTQLREHWFGTTVDQVVRYGDRPVLVVRQKTTRPYARIVVPVDFSTPSRRALEFGLLLFADASFTVLHAYDVPFKAFLTDPRTAAQIRIQHERELQVLVEDISRDVKDRFGEIGCEIAPLTEEGYATNVVLTLVRSAKPDLVVIGTHGRTGLRRAILGSIAEELISTLECDVLTVRPPTGGV